MKKFVLRHIFEIAVLGFCIMFAFGFDEVERMHWFRFVGGLFFLFFAFSFYLYLRHDKDKTSEDNIVMHPDVPSELSPSGASYLVHEKVDLNMVYGTLLYLTNKRALSLEMVENDYVFTLNERRPPLSPFEEEVVSWLFDGDGRSVSMNVFKDEYKGETGKQALIERLTSLEGIVKEEIGHLFLDLSAVKKRLNIILLAAIIPIALFGVATFGGLAVIPFLFLMLLSLYKIQNLMKKNDIGRAEYIKWVGFSLFLKEKMDAGRRNTHEVILWDHYMSYAVALGRANTAIRELDWLSGDIVEVNNGTSFMTNT